MTASVTANALLDRLPRTRVGVAAGRPRPAFRACGVAGFHVAVITALGGALLAGRSLLVTAALCVVCAAAFFAYTYLRRWVAGAERLVLLEHVWFAELSVALALRAAGEPVLPYLDVVAVALCPFLAAGRIGCTLVGCCHGRPSSLGIVYGEASARDGLPAALVGVRLFPVPLIEAAGLAAIGVVGLLALPRATAGVPLAWCLASYAVLRFGLEGLRGDARPHALGLSQARWMSLAELATAVAIADAVRPGAAAARPAAGWALLAAALGIGLVLRARRDAARRVLAPAHVAAVRALAEPRAGARPAARATDAGVTVAASARADGRRHVSLSLAGGADGGDLALLAGLAARAFPACDPRTAAAGAGGVLHVVTPAPAAPDAAPPDERRATARALQLYAQALRAADGAAGDGSNGDGLAGERGAGALWTGLALRVRAPAAPPAPPR